MTPETSDQTGSSSRKLYCLFDASVILPYYLPQAHKSDKVHAHATSIIESVRSCTTSHFLYIPNFCIAEVFSNFAKWAHGDWNKHVKEATIDARVYKSLCKQFQADIHNAALFYHYELSRYHVLTLNLVAPVDHYFKLYRGTAKRANPAGTFDQLIVAMGIHLTKIHGAGNVVLITADNRIAKIIGKCRSKISASARHSMQIDDAERLVGIPFSPNSFPQVLDLATASKKDLLALFGQWPLPTPTRYKKPYHLR